MFFFFFFYFLGFVLNSAVNLLIQIVTLILNSRRSRPWSGTWLMCEGHSLTLQHGIGLQQLFLDLIHLLALSTHRCHIWHHQLTGLWNTHTHTQITIRLKPLLDMAEKQVWRVHPSHHSPQHSPCLIPPWHPSGQGGDPSLVWGTEQKRRPHNGDPLCLVRWWPLLHHIIIIQMTHFTRWM